MPKPSLINVHYFTAGQIVFDPLPADGHREKSERMLLIGTKAV
jgi:hypothetical protein